MERVNEHKGKFKLGDIVIVTDQLAELTHGKKGNQVAQVVGIYDNFFNVEYPEGYQQSILYRDASKVLDKIYVM